MKRISENTVMGESRSEVLKVGKKKYIRIASPKGIEWKRHKTKHQVKQVEFNALENLYNKTYPPHFSPLPIIDSTKRSSKRSVKVIKDDKRRREIERGLVKAYAESNSKLTAVKYIKEETGWGLLESKNYFEAFLERQKAVADFF